MRKFVVLCAVALVVTVSGVGAQEMHEARTEHYRVFSSVSAGHARETAEAAQALSVLYNGFFRFDMETLPSPLRVRIFARRADFDRHLTRLIGETRDEAVYLHYTDHARSELVAYVMDDFEHFRASLTHQGVIQFFRAFIRNPPLWMREGFAVYLEDSYYDAEAGEAQFRPNNAWLETLQAMVAGDSAAEPLPLPEVLSADVETARAELETFYPQTWGMVSFLIGSDNPMHNRILWDSLSALEPNASLEQNVRNVERRALRWIDTDRLVGDFVEYISGLRSFRALVQEGIDLYGTSDWDEAENRFRAALEQRADSHVPYYYIGLIAYSRGNYDTATRYYQAALERGAANALTYYALGVNAFADSRFDEAVRYLEQSADEDPDAYGDRARELIARIDG